MGLISVQHKAKTCFLRNFLELSTNPNYQHSLLLSCYFRVHALGEDIPCPPLPPYFSQSLFDTIKSASEAGFDVSHMRNKQWYSFRMQQDFSENVNGKWEPKLCKIETRNPDANWERIWRNGRLSCLDNNSLSFAFMLIHDLLPSESKVSEIIGSSPPECKFSCQHISDYLHIFFECFHSSAIGDWLFNIVTKFDPSTNKSAILNKNDNRTIFGQNLNSLAWECNHSLEAL